MKAHNDEHAGSVPNLDILSMRHVAYIFDALIYYMRMVDSGEGETERTPPPWPDMDDEDSKVNIITPVAVSPL